jgi:hypothetical protein
VLASGRSRLSGCGSPMPDGWRWADDGRWACQLLLRRGRDRYGHLQVGTRNPTPVSGQLRKKQ